MNKYTVWVDKYKPKSLDDIIGHEKIINNFKKLSNHSNIPNIIITGISGIGKTTSILCFLKILIEKNTDKPYNINDYVLELNASDDLRKIDIIKKKLNLLFKKKINIILFYLMNLII